MKANMKLDPRLVGDGQVRFEGHNIFGATGELLVASSELRFRSQVQLTEFLISSGFTVEHVYGDWQRGPVAGTSRIMVFVVRRGRAGVLQCPLKQ